MLRLFNFIYRNRNTFLFLILEGIALLLIIRQNNHQRQILGDTILEFSAGIQERRNNALSYFYLREVNQSLMDENQELKDQMADLQQSLGELERTYALDSIPDALLGKNPASSPYRYVVCRVLKSTSAKNYNYITLDKGRNAGITEDMGVLSPNGIAGRVIKVTDEYALVLSAINVSFKLSVQTLEKENVGVFEWQGGDPLYGTLNYIPTDLMIKEGDTIVTSGYSQIFPPNYFVGTVVEVGTQKPSGFYEVSLRLGTNFRKLDYLYVLINDQKAALDSLETGLPVD